MEECCAEFPIISRLRHRNKYNTKLSMSKEILSLLSCRTIVCVEGGGHKTSNLKGMQWNKLLSGSIISRGWEINLEKITRIVHDISNLHRQDQNCLVWTLKMLSYSKISLSDIYAVLVMCMHAWLTPQYDIYYNTSGNHQACFLPRCTFVCHRRRISIIRSMTSLSLIQDVAFPWPL